MLLADIAAGSAAEIRHSFAKMLAGVFQNAFITDSGIAGLVSQFILPLVFHSIAVRSQGWVCTKTCSTQPVFYISFMASKTSKQFHIFVTAALFVCHIQCTSVSVNGFERKQQMLCKPPSPAMSDKLSQSAKVS